MIREKLYRDPVHDIIALDKNSREDRTLIRLIDTREMQRLRHVRQLGLTGLAYQGAEHTRFTHSLGVMWIARRILHQLAAARPITARQSFVTQCAALLHDVGHGPFSHLFEEFVGLHHETWTSRVILDPATEVHRELTRHDRRLPAEVVAVLNHRSRPGFLSQIISSQLDADRFDYLLRDSIMTGVKYGIYDLERIIHILRVDERGQHIVVARNGIHPVEKYLQSRYHMYSQVYRHKTVRAAEAMLGILLRRASEICARKGTADLAPDDPLARLLRLRSNVDLDTYLGIDDHRVHAALATWISSSDPVLSDLSERLERRRLFKTTEIPADRKTPSRIRAARRAVAEAGLDPRYYFALDEHRHVPYRPYDAKRPGDKGHILVEAGRPGATCQDIHELSAVVRGLTSATATSLRAVFPERSGRTNLRSIMARIFHDR